MTDNLRWGKLESTSGGHTQPLVTADGDPVAVYAVTDGTVSITPTGTGPWKITGSPESGLSASLPDGRVFTATGRDKKIGRAERIDANLSGSTFTFVNEVKSDWIIDDAEENKVAQFTGANHGVRHPVVEFEDGVSIGCDEAVFLSWIAREALERKMLSSTAILTICLIVLTPIIIAFFLL
ncbi:hypothetical protein ACFSSC_02995 [Corynebacterium mendelii]|uniref:Uncharacterized protein n=1 Tax=Corynebacterium mendelii TaxID=2765362 RepID=A0A939DZQ7_9CORY|nr:hypothetical protein [Corynebacterium mendelii]MBN9644244.1 hypothetical protein [Corynebacterium mendelii]